VNTDRKNQPVAAVTGATGSIGKAIATGLAKLDYQVVLITRDELKSIQVVEEIKQSTGNRSISYQLADLSRKQSIVDLVESWRMPLKILINNAAVTPKERKETPEGIELQFATNVLGYFWTSIYFRKLLQEFAPARIVNVASYWAGGLDLTDLEFEQRSYDNNKSYRQSKQANRMLTPVFAKKFAADNIVVNSCHPGDVNSKLSNNLGFGGSQSPQQGAKTPIWVATSDSIRGVTGKYFENKQITSCRFARLQEESHELFSICKTY
jgi:retinol dehydrogenase-13